MSLWIAPVDVGMGRAVLIDGVRELPLPIPLFEDMERAEDFCTFAELAGFARAELARMGRDSLDRLYTAWLAAKEADRYLNA